MLKPDILINVRINISMKLCKWTRIFRLRSSNYNNTDRYNTLLYYSSQGSTVCIFELFYNGYNL